MKKLLSGLAICYAFSSHAQEQFTVHFDFAKYALTPTALSQLDSFLSAEKSNLKVMSVNLHGYCDFIGSDGYNDRLSQQRINSVKKYLVSKGLGANHIYDEIGHGERDALNTNSSDEERQANRRVTILFNRGVMPDNDKSSLDQRLKDTALKAGDNIVLKNINFYGGHHQFLPSSKPMLKELLDAMQSYPKLVIRIEGHICCEATPGDGLDAETNLYNLSEARAKAIMDYLIEQGIAASRISYKGFGHSNPIYPYPEQTEDQMIENRRVEIKIISK